MSVHFVGFHLLPTAYCLLPAAYCLLPTAYYPPWLESRSAVWRIPQPRFWGGIPKVKGKSETEIPVETLCINNDVGQGTILGAMPSDGIFAWI